MQDNTLGRQARQWREFALIVGPAVAVVAAGFWLAFQFVEPAPPRKIVMTTGSQSGGYYAFGKRYAEILKESGVDLELRTSPGSVENLNRLRDPASGVSVALLQGGIGTRADAPHLVSLGRLFLEPVWIFVRSDIPGNRLTALAGRRIVVGPPGSGTRVLAEALLEANAVSAANATLLAHGSGDGVEALLQGEADAIFLVVSAQAPVAHKLLRAAGVRLMSLDQADAYTRLFPYLTKVTVPMGMIDLVANVPAADTTLVAAEAALVARSDLHPALVGLLVEAAKEVHNPASTFQRFKDFPKPADPDFPVSEDAERVYASGQPFLMRFLPFWLATFLERMAIMVLPIATILLPLIKIVPMIYDWRVRRRIFYWYGQLKRLEKRMGADDNVTDIDAHLAAIAGIEDAVGNIPVPLLYSVDFYDLKAAIDLVEQKLLTRRASAEVAHAAQ